MSIDHTCPGYDLQLLQAATGHPALYPPDRLTSTVPRFAGDPPSESTIRRTLQLLHLLHADGLDRVLGLWARLREPTQKGRRVIAIDGKSVRGSATVAGRCRHLFSVLSHTGRLVLGQIDVDNKTNEIPMFAALLDTIDLLGVLVTADALHCQAGHANYLVEQRGAHYLFTVKGNQPKLRA